MDKLDRRNYQRYYQRGYYYRKKCEKLEAELDRLKSEHELGKAYTTLFWMMFRYVFSPNSITAEKLKKYHEALGIIANKDVQNKDILIPRLSKLLAELEKKLEASKTSQKI